MRRIYHVLNRTCLSRAQEKSRVDVVHPLEAKRGCEALQRALRMVEDNVRAMFADVQTLKDGNFHQAEQLHRR